MQLTSYSGRDFRQGKWGRISSGKKKCAENITAAMSVQYVLNQKGEHVLGSTARTQMF